MDISSEECQISSLEPSKAQTTLPILAHEQVFHESADLSQCDLDLIMKSAWWLLSSLARSQVSYAKD